MMCTCMLLLLDSKHWYCLGQPGRLLPQSPQIAIQLVPAVLPTRPPTHTRPCRLLGRQQRGAALLVRANWGAPVEFAAGRVLQNDREAEQLQRLKVHIGGAASAYTKAGQFIQASGEGDGHSTHALHTSLAALIALYAVQASLPH